MEKRKKALQSNLDSEEKELLFSFENNEWKTVGGFVKNKTDAKKASSDTLRKERNV